MRTFAQRCMTTFSVCEPSLERQTSWVATSPALPSRAFGRLDLHPMRANLFGQGSGNGTSTNGYRVDEKITEAGMPMWREQLCDLNRAGKNNQLNCE